VRGISIPPRRISTPLGGILRPPRGISAPSGGVLEPVLGTDAIFISGNQQFPQKPPASQGQNRPAWRAELRLGLPAAAQQRRPTTPSMRLKLLDFPLFSIRCVG